MYSKKTGVKNNWSTYMHIFIIIAIVVNSSSLIEIIIHQKDIDLQRIVTWFFYPTLCYHISLQNVTVKKYKFKY